jgi:glycosyltransferase involved in cell wall biosynthesis
MEEIQDPKRIAIFTTFADFSPAYSLCRIANDQIKMLVSNGYHPTVIVQESFKTEGAGAFGLPEVTIARIPTVACHNEVKKDETFDEDVTTTEQALEKILKNIDVVISHDVIYQNAALKHNFAARRVASKHPNIKWLHWIHSATSPITLNALRPIFADEYLELVKKPFPNSLYVFFNHYSIPRIANDFGVDEEVVRIVHHPSDVGQVLGLSKDVAQFMREKKILDADAVCVYGCRLDRGKNVEMAIKTMAMIKDFGLKVRMIVTDFHSTGGDKITYRDDLKNIGIDWGLNSEELIFTSEHRPEWSVEVPYDDALGIQRLANVMIMPSMSESYSLVTQEAGINKCVMVLNQDFPPFRDIFGQNAIFRKYSSNIDVLSGLAGNTNTQYGPDKVSEDERKHHEKIYHQETAGMIVSKLNSYKDLALANFLRKNRNLDTVFKKELEPLFFEE